jgi:hypothetical protein
MVYVKFCYPKFGRDNYMEEQAHDLYNKAIFVKFQPQLKETTALCVDEIIEKKKL